MQRGKCESNENGEKKRLKMKREKCDLKKIKIGLRKQ